MLARASLSAITKYYTAIYYHFLQKKIKNSQILLEVLSLRKNFTSQPIYVKYKLVMSGDYKTLSCEADY